MLMLDNYVYDAIVASENMLAYILLLALLA